MYCVSSHVGQSRSAAVVTAYLMKCHKMNFVDACAKLQQLKPDVKLRNVPKEMFAADPSLSTCSEVAYRCKMCRRTLFNGSSILSHPVGHGPTAFGHKKLSNQQRGYETQCTSYFTEPVQWMEQAFLGVMNGQLLCPKCSSKLGSFNWCGEQCSCGRWVTPAFQMHKNRVDEKHISIATFKS
uniref:protein-tyrosine-phosphatase n=1 Tax=Esox lucius TaxID=8010 RepID=A0A6Q2X6Y2_ESOLU